MIPVGLYHDKIGELQQVLHDMGNEPHELAAWLFDDRNLSAVKLAKLRSSSEQSSSLIRSMPKFSGASVLGLKLTEPVRRKQVDQILELNQNALFEEVKEIEHIERELRNTHSFVLARLQSVKRLYGYLQNTSRFDAQHSKEASEQAQHVEKTVLPVLIRLKAEVESAIKMCGRELKERTREIERIDRSKVWSPKYQRRIRRKRLARAAAKAAAAAEAEKKADKGLDKDGD